MFFQDHLPLVLTPNLTTLDECFVCEIQNGSKRFFLTVLYRYPSQSIEPFSLFKQKWEEITINTNDCSPTISMRIGEFNARNSEWWNGDSTNLQGTELAEPAAEYSLNQVTDGPSHIAPNYASCVDSIVHYGNKFCHQLGSSSSAIFEMSSPINFFKIEFHYSFSSHLQAENLGFHNG